MTTDTEEFLAHHGVKGMKWGVRKDRGHEGQKAKTKKIAKLDKKFERNAHSLDTFIKVNNAAAKKCNELDVDRINNKPAYKGKDFTKDTPLRRKYYKEHQDAFLKRLEDAAGELGTNASGTRKYTIFEDGNGGWSVTTTDAKHADEPVVKVRPKYDKSGHILELEIVDDAIEQDAMVGDFIDDVVEHYGVKGMKWGQRRAKGDDGKRTPATATKRRVSSGATAIVKRARGTRTKDVKQLSDKELQDALRRMNMERQYKTLKGQGVDKATADFVKDIGKSAVKSALTAAATAQVAKLIKVALEKK